MYITSQVGKWVHQDSNNILKSKKQFLNNQKY
jgi:hypothetical protein